MRDLAVMVGCGQPVGGHGRIVAGVDDVVHHARIISIRLEERREHRHRFVLLHQARVVRRLRRKQRERVKGAGVHIAGETSVQAAHCRGVDQNTGRIILAIGMIEAGKCGDICALALGARDEVLCLLHLRPSELHVIGVWAAPDFVEEAHRNSPVRHRAAWVALGKPLKLVSRLFIPEVMQQSYAAIEKNLRRRGTGDWKRNRAKPFTLSAISGAHRRVVHGLGRKRKSSQNKQKCHHGLHGGHYRLGVQRSIEVRSMLLDSGDCRIVVSTASPRHTCPASRRLGLRELFMAKRSYTFYLGMLVLFFCFHLDSASAQQVPEGRVFGGYFEEWDVRYSGYTMATLEKSGVAARLTHLIYAFGSVTPGLSPVCAIVDPNAAWQDASILAVDGKPFSGSVHGNFAGILELKTLHPRLRTLISLGGQAGDVSGFTAAAASPVARRALVASCIDLFVEGHLAPGVEAPGLFDGFNVDWEFPLPADRDNFTALLHEFRAQLDALGRSTGRHYILTFDSPSDPRKYANIDLKAAADEVDFLTIDGYDYAAPSEKSTNASSALYNSPADPLRDQARAIDDTVRAYLKAGVPAAKYTMGMPLYGIGWSGVAKRNHGLYQSAAGPGPRLRLMEAACVLPRAELPQRRGATPS